MTAFASDRTMACSGGRMAVRGGEGGNTTARWRDKSARCAAWCGRVFSVAYGALARGAPDRRGLQIGRAHVLTPVTNAHIVCRLLLAKKKRNTKRTLP